MAVTGEVGTELSLSYDELLNLGLVEFDAVLVCVHNRLGWSRLGNARWLGVPLKSLLDRAGPSSRQANLVTRAVDGWECTLPLRELEQSGGYVVVGMKGHPLTPAHGFPARVFVPGIYGQYTGAKWLTELRIQSAPNPDYWLRRGWTRGPLRVRPLSRIDHPADGSRVTAGALPVTGVAWAPPSGVREVHVAVDDGDWTPAELAAELAPTSWRRWRHPVDLAPGIHRIRVRCVAADGQVQDAVLREPFPGGVTGHHTITVNTG